MRRAFLAPKAAYIIFLRLKQHTLFTHKENKVCSPWEKIMYVSLHVRSVV